MKLDKALESKLYAYDKSNNLLGQGQKNHPISNNSNQLGTFEYDASGNQLNWSDQELTYNCDGQLISIKSKDFEEYYTYASGGARIKKVTDYLNAEGSVYKVEIVQYLGLVEFRSSRSIPQSKQKSDHKPLGFDETIEKVVLRLKSDHGQYCKISQDLKTGDRSHAYTLTNNIENNVGVMDKCSKLQSFQNYSPYGEPSKAHGNTKDKQLGFTDQEQDQSSLNYYGYRYYNSSQGRWIQPDPIGFKSGQLNLYSLLKGNPVRQADSMGLGKDDIVLFLPLFHYDNQDENLDFFDEYPKLIKKFQSLFKPDKTFFVTEEHSGRHLWMKEDYKRLNEISKKRLATLETNELIISYFLRTYSRQDQIAKYNFEEKYYIDQIAIFLNEDYSDYYLKAQKTMVNKFHGFCVLDCGPDTYYFKQGINSSKPHNFDHPHFKDSLKKSRAIIYYGQFGWASKDPDHLKEEFVHANKSLMKDSSDDDDKTEFAEFLFHNIFKKRDVETFMHSGAFRKYKGKNLIVKHYGYSHFIDPAMDSLIEDGYRMTFIPAGSLNRLNKEKPQYVAFYTNGNSSDIEKITNKGYTKMPDEELQNTIKGLTIYERNSSK